MNRLFHFVRSDLFLSIAGGFALGVAGLTILSPAAARNGDNELAKSISVEVPVHVENSPK